MQEGVSIVVVFYVKRPPHPRWHLIDETKGATVVTPAHIIKDVLCELEAELFTVSPLDVKSEPLPSSLDLQVQLLVGGMEMIIYHIAEEVPVDGDQPVSWLKARPFRQAALLHTGHSSTRTSVVQPLTSPLLKMMRRRLAPLPTVLEWLPSYGRKYSSVAADKSL